MPDYPRTSLINHLLFETPWPGLSVFAALTIVLAWQALRRRGRRLAIAAAAAALLAGLFPLLSYAVTTTSERLSDQTRRLIRIGADDSEPGPRSLMTDDVTLEAPEGEVVVEGIEEMGERIDAARRRYPIEGWRVLTVDGGRVDADTARSFLSIRTTHAMTGSGLMAGEPVPALTSWLMDWRRVDRQWRIERIILLRLNRAEPRPGVIP